jgi:hypothetical protein
MGVRMNSPFNSAAVETDPVLVGEKEQRAEGSANGKVVKL